MLSSNDRSRRTAGLADDISTLARTVMQDLAARVGHTPFEMSRMVGQTDVQSREVGMNLEHTAARLLVSQLLADAMS